MVYDAKIISYQIESLEKRYEAENRFMENIAQGNFHQVEIDFDNNTFYDMEKLSNVPINSIKTNCIIMNTLLRKAAEQGGVHPIHIERVSVEISDKIENLTFAEDGKSLAREMIHSYGLLVKNYSLKNFSPFIQKVLTRVETDLSADQSLNKHAQILNINPSYLSTLFRKETGITLTEHVNRKRVEYGTFLLNTTNLQIQVIAQNCGISDINYFTRIFKKYIGKTPKEYRNSIGS